MKEKLQDLLSELSYWGKKSTSIHGVKIIKIPENKTNFARLALEIKPLKKKSRTIVSNEDLLIKYKEIFENEKLSELIRKIDEVREDMPKKNIEENSGKFQL